MGQKVGYYVPLYCGLRDDTKLVLLARKLKAKDKDHVRAKLENLWMWALMQRPDGVIESALSVEDLAHNCNWQGDAKEWVDALIQYRWLDKRGDGSLKIHEWELYGGKLLQAVAYSREHTSAARNPIVQAFDRIKSPGLVAKARAIDELIRQGLTDKQIVESAIDPARQTWDFWAHIRTLTPNHKPEVKRAF